MSLEDINYKAERLDDKHFKIKFKTGEDIYNARNAAIGGEIFLTTGDNGGLYFATQTSDKGNDFIYEAGDLSVENKLPFSRSYLKVNTGAHANTSTNTGESFTCKPGARTGNMTFSIWMRAYRTDSIWSQPFSTLSSGEANITANSKSLVLWYVNPETAGGSLNQLMGYQNANGGYLGPSTPIENVEPLIWHHYAVTREVGAGTAGYDKMKVYLNGVHQSGHDWEVITDGIVFGRDIDDDGVATDDYLYFGSDIGYYAGGWDLDQTAIFDETLNASQIAEIYNGGRAGNIKSIGQGPTNWWRMEEVVSGKILDEGSDGTRHIVFFNNPDHSVIAEHSTYSSFKSLKFNGTSSDKLLIQNFKLSGAFSLSVWVKAPQGFNPTSAVFPLGNACPEPHDPGLNELFFDIGGGSIRVTLYDTVNGGSLNYEQNVSESQWGDNYWSHFIVTYDGGQSADGIRAYQLGVEKEITDNWIPSREETGNFQQFSISNNALAIGSKPTSAYNEYQEGILSKYVIWNKALSPEEVVEVYNGGQPLDFSAVEDRIKPKHWWKLENDVKDYISGKDGTLTGGEFVAIAPHYVGINPY